MSSEAVRAARNASRRAGVLAAEELALTEQIREADERVRELTARYHRERGDVIELERVTFTSVLARLIRSRDERLARERAEVDTVRLQLQAQEGRHRALLAERATVRRDIIAL